MMTIHDWRRRHRRFHLVVAACLGLAAAGCSRSTTSSSTSGGPGTTVGSQCDAIASTYCQHEMPGCLTKASDGSPVTAQDQCNEIAQAVCQRLETCGDTTPQATCVDQALSGCCNGNAGAGLCADDVISPESNVQSCVGAIGSSLCPLLEMGSMPPECNQVIVAAPPSEADCESQAHDACCGTAGTCQDPSSSSPAAIETCEQGIDALACGDSLPADCQSVITPASFAPRVAVEKDAPASPAPGPSRIAAWMRQVRSSVLERR